MADVLISDVPDAVLPGVDAHADRLGISRVEYMRRRPATDAAATVAHVSPDDLREFARTYADLADDHVTGTAWR